MTWPAAQVKTNVDAAGDDPKLARSDFAANVDKFNQMRSHVSSFMQGVLDDADADAARVTLDAQQLDATLTSLAAVAGVAGDVLYASGTDVWARLAKGSDGEALVLASGIPSWGAAGGAVVRKAADETVNNSTTLQDDNHLLFALEANTTYFFRLFVLFDSGTTPDLKVGWSVPASCTMLWDALGGFVAHDETETRKLSGQGGPLWVNLEGVVRCGGTSGNLQMRWAQETADVSDTKVLKDSVLIFRNIGAT